MAAVIISAAKEVRGSETSVKGGGLGWRVE